MQTETLNGILYIITIALVIALLATQIMTFIEVSKPREAPQINITLNEEVKTNAPLYENVIKRFAQTHEYETGIYNCVNYSQDLGSILEQLGYDVVYDIYAINDTTSHMVVDLRLEVEPQTGEVVVNRE